MSRLSEGIYYSFTGWSSVITMVLSVYIGYLLWGLIYQGVKTVVMSKRLWAKSSLYIGKGRAGARLQISRLFVRQYNKVLPQLTSVDLEEEENFTVGVKLKSGETVRVKLDDFHDFMENNYAQIAIQQSEPKKPRGLRRGDLTEWDAMY